MRLHLLAVPALLFAQDHFEYDQKAPLDVRNIAVQDRAGVKVHDISYASPHGGRVPAFLVVPPGKGPHAAILWGHWMMKGSTLRNRGEFLDEAVLLARSGAVSLLIDAPYVRPGFVEDRDPLSGQDAHAARQQVVDFRRGIDLLTARPDVDPKRIAYVGHSFDAHVGGILCGVEKRIGSFVLMAGAYSNEEYAFDPAIAEMEKFRKELGEPRMREYLRRYAWDDPVHYIGRSAPAAVFLQYGSKDDPIPEHVARRDFAKFGDPKRIEFYDAGHALNAAARRDRAAWLVERLRLRQVDKAQLEAIPDLK